MTPAGRVSRGGWALVALLLLAVPLVQGGTPRLPTLAVELGAFLLLASRAVSWARSPRRELSFCALDALLAVIGLWTLISVVSAPYFHAAEAAALLFAAYAGLYWLLSFNPSAAGLSLALGAVRVQAAVQSLLVLFAAAGGRDRPAGTFFNPNFLAGFLAAAVLLAAGRLAFPPAEGRRRGWQGTVLAAGEVALLLAALLATGSRGGALALAAGMLVLLSLRSLKAATVVTTAGIALLLLVPNPLVQRLKSLPQTDNFAFTRLQIWKSAASMMLDHPWAGVGLGQFEYVAERYAFPAAGHWAKYTHVAENAHSEYLQAGAELGIPGLLGSVAALALLLGAVVRRLRELHRDSRGPVATLGSAVVTIAVQAAVDFPLHTPPAALLLVALAAGLRLHGASGPTRVVRVRLRPAYAAAAAVVTLLLAAAAIRPVAGFWFYLAGIGAPRNLLREKWALEQAPRAEVPLPEAVRLIGRAARIDFTNASYRRALGSVFFQLHARGQGGDDALRRALFHLNYAAELNPNQHQYELNLGQALTSLARLHPPGRDRLEAALGHYRRAARLAPCSVQAWTEIGLLADELGDPVAAEGAFRRAVGLEEYFLRGWFNLGTFHARHGRLDEAREAFARGASLAEQAPTLVRTTEAEAALLAIEPSVFYNELEKIKAQEGLGESAS